MSTNQATEVMTPAEMQARIYWLEGQLAMLNSAVEMLRQMQSLWVCVPQVPPMIDANNT